MELFCKYAELRPLLAGRGAKTIECQEAEFGNGITISRMKKMKAI